MSVLGYKSVLVDTRWKLCFQAVQGCVGHNYSCSTRLIKKKQGELSEISGSFSYERRFENAR